MKKPLCIDLYAGLGGWTEGFLAEGYDVIGFDIERHAYDGERYPAQLVLQDVLTLHGSQFRHATCIVASSPCQAYSYMAMPWTRAKQLAKALRGEGEFPEGYTGYRTIADLNALFEAPARIQREASEAAGRHIPMIQENVRGAIPWVGRSAWNFGSYHLWGDVPALMPIPHKAAKLGGGASWHAPDDPRHQPGLDFTRLAGRSDGVKAAGGTTVIDANGNRHISSKWRSKEDWNANSAGGVKHGGEWWHDPDSPGRQGGVIADPDAGTKGFAARLGHSAHARTGSKSTARKAASARIAKIPLPLARHIAHVYHARNT